MINRLHRLNIFYLLLEKLNGFAENSKTDVSMPAAQVAEEYEAKRTDAWAQIEDLNITKRLISTCEYLRARAENWLTRI